MITNKNYVLDSRYKEQQKVLLKVANQLGVVYFKPDYHAKNNDCNTVLFYFKKDYDKAVAM
ncbi:MAG: hypothetical protein K2H01_10875, partial [Ruminococcus sp.]|nr:hypothetical protein [Ruminococcus sp.]